MRDLDEPGLYTVAIYQSLHAAMSRAFLAVDKDGEETLSPKPEHITRWK